MSKPSFVASDVIAVGAMFVAITTFIIQVIYERKREWHSACEILFRSLDSMYEEIIELVINPNEFNHISYQYCLNKQKNLFEHYCKRFFLQRNRIETARRIIVDDLMSITLNVKYETLINKGFKKSKDQNLNRIKFVQEIRNYTIKASEALIK